MPQAVQMKACISNSWWNEALQAAAKPGSGRTIIMQITRNSWAAAVFARLLTIQEQRRLIFYCDASLLLVEG